VSSAGKEIFTELQAAPGGVFIPIKSIKGEDSSYSRSEREEYDVESV
jgi:hypothetical protein